MKQARTKFVKIRFDEDERERVMAAFRRQERNLSDEVRRYLLRAVRAMEKREQNDE